MAAKFFFAWSMFAAAEAQDNRDYSAKCNARARASIDPLLDLTERQFRDRYRISKKMFKWLCRELKTSTNLRSSQRVSLQLKVRIYFPALPLT